MQAGEDFDHQRSARRRRAVVGRPRPHDQLFAAVGGHEEAAVAVAEPPERVVRPRLGALEIGGRPRRLEQAQRRARHRGVIVEQARRARAPVAPGVQQAALRVAQVRGDERERGLGRGEEVGRVEHGRGASKRGDRQPVPVGENLVVAAGPRALLAFGEQKRAAGGEARFARRVAARA